MFKIPEQYWRIIIHKTKKTINFLRKYEIKNWKIS